MYEQKNKPKENKSRVAVEFIADKKSSAKQDFGFLDNRKVSQAQKTMQLMSLKKSSDVSSVNNDLIIQRAVGNTGLQNIKDAIYNGNNPRGGAIIATDIYEHDGPGNGDFTVGTVPKIKENAMSIGYSDAYATRLANNNPFGVGDIPGQTRWADANDAHPRQVESFQHQGLTDPHGHTVSKHELNFENIYNANGKATFKYNARNPSLANFYASDVTAAQRDFIDNTPGLAGGGEVRTVVRENIQSVNGGEWKLRHPNMGRMSAPALADFLANTDNGKSTVNMFRNAYRVIRGDVLAYDGGPEWSAKLTLGPWI